MSYKMNTSNKRYPSLRTIMSIGLMIVGVIASGLVSYLLYNSYSSQVREDLRRRIINISDIIALQLDAESLGAIDGEASMQNADYIKYQDFLFNILRKESEITYIYTIKRGDDGNLYFYLDVGNDPSIEEYDVGIPGDVPYEEPSDLLLAVLNTPEGTVAEEEIYSDEFGSFLSAYTPIFNDDGTLNSVLGVDITADTVIAQERNVLSQTLLYFLISLPVIAFVGLLLGNLFARPTIALTQAVNRVAGGDIQPIKSLPSPSLETHQLMTAFNAMAERLRDLINNLEINVEKRTSQLEKQSLRLRVVSEIVRDATTEKDVLTLLERGAKFIQDRFNFYQTGIFLIDSDRQFAVLTASPTDAGRQMIANGHRLLVGEVGIVGRVAATGEPRITLDTGLDAVHFNNPLLPNTRSEMALPLKVENRIIGVLDVQSDQPNAFSEDDIAIMQVLADQLAIAIERTQLFQQVEENLRELQQAYGRSTREGWRSLTENELLSNTGYHFDNVKIKPITTTPELGTEAMQQGSIIFQKGDGRDRSNQSVAAIPIKLRGQSIGVVTVKLKESYNSSTISTIEQAVERLASSLESARLFEEARQRADREQAIAQVTSAISSAGDFDAILRTTVEEIGKSLGESEVSIQIVDETESL